MTKKWQLFKNMEATMAMTILNMVVQLKMIAHQLIRDHNLQTSEGISLKDWWLRLHYRHSFRMAHWSTNGFAQLT